MANIKTILMVIIVIIGIALLAWSFFDLIIKNWIEAHKDKKDEGMKRKLKKANPFDHTPEKLVNAPVILYKLPGHQNYCEYEVTKSTIKIGKAKDNDLRIIEDDTVENHHAILRKRIDGNRVYYEFENLAKTNPSEYLSKDSKEDYDVLRYKETQELGGEERFYVGETKLLIKTPHAKHTMSDTDKLRDLNDEDRKDMHDTKVNMPKKKRKKARHIEPMDEEEIIDPSNTDTYNFDI